MKSTCNPGCGEVLSLHGGGPKKRTYPSSAASSQESHNNLTDSYDEVDTPRRLTRLRRTASGDESSWSIQEDQCQTIVAMKTSTDAPIKWVGEFKLIQSDGSFFLKSTAVTQDWVKKNFRFDFCKKCNNNPNVPMTVPPGSSDSSLDLTSCDTAPACTYSQAG